MIKHLYNWNITGHDRGISELEKEIAAKNVAHAYLFSGPEQVGKFTVAKTLAHILQCPDNYCHNCPVCREIDKGYHADTIEISDNGESIKIEEIRDIISRLNMSRNGAYRILLVQNVERMTLEAANAMLKTLEDPPGGVIFLLTTSRIREILATIISRVRVYNFQRLPEQKILELLQELYPLADLNLLEQVVSFSMGKPGRAVKYMQDPQLLEQAREMYNDVSLFVKKPDRASEFAYIADLVKMSKETESDRPIRDFMDIFTAVLRKKLLEMPGGANAAGGTINLIRETQKAQDLLKRNVNTRLLLENLMLQLC